MLSFFGHPTTHCDRVTRRNFLTAGAIGVGGLTLVDLLRAEARAGIGSSRKAVIHVHLDGGPPQMDMIDPKPEAPRELRGVFSPISTKVPGIHLTELLPKTAAIADRFVFLRSVVGSDGKHDAFQCQSGFDAKNMASQGGRPAMGAAIAKLRGRAGDSAPPFVDLMQGRGLARNSTRPGFLGPAYGPFRPDISKLFQRKLEAAMVKELAAKGTEYQTSLDLLPGLSAKRLRDRTSLLAALDRMRRDADASGMMDAADQFTHQAFEMLTSGRFADAIDLSQEDPKVLKRYHLDASAAPGNHTTSDTAAATRKLLIARRLVEVGVRCVSVSISDFDTHTSNFKRLEQIVPIFDHAISTLVIDLEQRGMLDDVSIIAWGEFGRTPKVNAKGGRDHWPVVSMAMLAGGGIRAGQVIGSTDRIASAVRSRPVHFQEVLATVYHNLGFNLDHTTLTDTRGRPHYLLDRRTPIRELV
jgi:hypothetical protein